MRSSQVIWSYFVGLTFWGFSSWILCLNCKNLRMSCLVRLGSKEAPLSHCLRWELRAFIAIFFLNFSRLSCFLRDLGLVKKLLFRILWDERFSFELNEVIRSSFGTMLLCKEFNENLTTLEPGSFITGIGDALVCTQSLLYFE